MQTKTLLLNQGSPETKRQELKHYFNETFELYEDLFKLIKRDEAYFLRPEPLRHPLIFYFGHTATFFINKCILAKLITERINGQFESMFAIGVDEMSWDDLDETHYDWPSVDAVRDYRAQVKQSINGLIDTLPLSMPIKPRDPAWVILMGIEHERIHLETSSVIMRMLPLHEITPNARWAACTHIGQAPKNTLIPIQGRTITLGKPETDATYGWDNEYGQQTQTIDDFKVSQYLVTNAEFLSFVEAGGYQTPEHWTEEGQQWLSFTQAKHPRFWRENGHGRYAQRNLTEEIPLPLNWPVEVNYLEAKAFTNWLAREHNKHMRLPTEAEWCLLRTQVDTDQPHWQEAPGNINLEYFASSCPVDRFATTITQGDHVSSLYDIIGNVWQWTETPIDAYDGFEVHPVYDDFSTPTFDGKHNLIKGGSWISTGNESLQHSRYAFRRHFFQHAGFRYVQANKELTMLDVNPYETDALVAQYLEFHYGNTYFDVPNFPKACSQACIALTKGHPRKRALDLGCAVGRATFELAQYFEHVDGIDFSARFIQCAFRLLETGQIRYTIPTEGDLVEYQDVSLANLGLAQNQTSIGFAQGDAINLKSMYSGYDLIFAGNLIDRLYEPGRFLEVIQERLNPGGFLVLTSPYTWLTEYTRKTHWLGGYKVNGENLYTEDALAHLLKAHFEHRSTQDVPFVIRETSRKFQHTIAQMTCWQKRT